MKNRAHASGSDSAYPRELEELEAAAIRERRRVLATDPCPVSGSEAPAAAAPARSRHADPLGLPPDTCGMAFSGGGIRSATFHLGFLQTLARQRVLTCVDLLSTVSGGGYVGGFLGRMYDRLRGRSRPVRRALEVLADTDSRPMRWLRQHGKYIAPSGSGDWRVNIAIVLRSFLTLHCVILVFLFAGFGLLNSIRFGLLDPLVTVVRAASHAESLGFSSAWLGAFWSPWFLLAELLVLFWVLPCMFAYWLVSEVRLREFVPVTFRIAFVFLAAPFLLGMLGVNQLGLFLPAAAVFASMIFAAASWVRVSGVEQSIGSGVREVAQLRPRQILTYSLGAALVGVASVLGVAVVDSLGHALQQYTVHNRTYSASFAAIGATLAAGLPLLQRTAKFIEGLFSGSGKERPGFVGGLARSDAVQAVLLLVVAGTLLTVASFLAHMAFRGGDWLSIGLGATTAAVVFSVWLNSDSGRTLVNRSALSALYSTRLCRAYLGATNPERASGRGRSVDQVVSGDDVESLTAYRPHEAGGPLPIINVCLNQTIDFHARRGTRDRKGENVAVSPLGITVGRDSHAAWILPTAQSTVRTQELVAIGRQPGQSHPFVAEDRVPDGMQRDARYQFSPRRLWVAVERLPLRTWIAISGAAFAPGSGVRTKPSLALLMTLANVRLGYWWDSGLDETSRVTESHQSIGQRLGGFLTQWLVVQGLLLAEATAKFPGAWSRHWYLSDGGFFENLGLYELVRRRVPYVIGGDASADPEYGFGDLTEFVRKVRIDFGAEVVPFSAAELDAHVPAEVRGLGVGPLADLDRGGAGAPRCYATLFWILHRGTSATAPCRSVLLYVKAAAIGDEPVDVEGYRRENPDFPHQSTADQFYDEQQWESYRSLGEHAGKRLFGPDPLWLFRIPV